MGNTRGRRVMRLCAMGNTRGRRVMRLCAMGSVVAI